MKKWKQWISIGLACTMLSGSTLALAEAAPIEAEEAVELEKAAEAEETEELAETVEAEGSEGVAEAEKAVQDNIRDGQLTMEDIAAFNGGEDKAYIENGRVTFVEGTCTQNPVSNEEEAAAVVDAMMTLIGADANTEFVLWDTVTDPMGNIYYIFQQMYQNTTVCGGAVKVITDAEGNMIGLTSSVESEMPEVASGEGITAREAEQIVVEKEQETSGLSLKVKDQFTNTVILPSVLKFDMESEDGSSRFAWVVYTDNPSGNFRQGNDLPYLAHYVSMTGEYLYNMPAITPDDEAGQAGYDSSYVFEFMEPAEYTGYVDLSDGSEKEITVTVMRDKRTGMYYLGNIERRIVVAECYDFLYGDGQVVLEASEDNREWDQVGLLSLYNYCRAWDYYNEIGWTGPDGKNTPTIILNNFCDDHYNEVNNACYVGKIYGMQAFLASKINDFSQCLDVIAHEFTHCVTGSLMTYNSYMNDYGAINEAMSDIQGKNCEMMAGDVDLTDWELGANSLDPIRSMSDPHQYMQPEFAWDLYYMPEVETPTDMNDHGGVHFNSSLLNRVSYMLVEEGGMSLEEARVFWFVADCAMVPQTDYDQLARLLPWVMKIAGMEQYEDTLTKAIEETRLGEDDMPVDLGEDRALLKVSLPKTEAFDAGNWMLSVFTVKVDVLVERISTLFFQVMSGDFSAFPESLQLAIAEGREKLESRLESSDNLLDLFVTALKEAFTTLVEEGWEKQEEKVARINEKTDVILEDMRTWLADEMREIFFQGVGIAGQDGSTVQMVVKSGRTIPMLQHATLSPGSDVPDQLAMAVYIHGKWYELESMEAEEVETEDVELTETEAEEAEEEDEAMEAEVEEAEEEGEAEEAEVEEAEEEDEAKEAVVEEGEAEEAVAEEVEGEETKTEENDIVMEILYDLLGEDGENLRDIRSLDDILDLFSVNVVAGEVLELSSEGLDGVDIPDPTPFEEKEFGTIEPGPKSRPKE